MTTKSKGYTLRFDGQEGSDRLAAIKALHRETYPQHGLSFNAWCLQRLAVGQPAGDQVMSAFEALCQAADALTEDPPDTPAARAHLDQALSLLLAVVHDFEAQHA